MNVRSVPSSSAPIPLRVQATNRYSLPPPTAADTITVYVRAVVGARLWLVAGVVATIGVAHGEDASSPRPFGPVIPPVPCPTTAAARGWIRGTVTSLEQATLGCTPIAGVAAPAGCVIGSFDPWCDRKPQNVTLSIDGALQAVTWPERGDWQVCGLSPGNHVLTVCSSRGDFRCAAEASTVLQLVEVEPRVHVRVDRVFVGRPSWSGQQLSFTLGNAQRATDLKLPAQIALAWTEEGDLPHAYLCEPPRSPAPGCSRCDAASDPEQAALFFAVVAFAVGRRRR